MENDSRQSVITLPNFLTLIRLIGSPLLIPMAIFNWYMGLIVWAVILVVTEWLDGILARVLHQESKLGARLDTIADAVFYLCVIITLTVIDPRFVVDQAYWIGAAVVSYWLSWLVSWIRFRRLPSYHTWAAKGAWMAIAFGLFALIAGWTPWPFRAAMLIVVAANIEAIMISLVLKQPRVDVPSLWHALKSIQAPFRSGRGLG